jgi:hypothetical protein
MTLDEKLFNTLKFCSLEVPSGYITVGLSSEGKLGAPQIFHARDFVCQELLDLSLVDQEARPRYLIKLLQNLILEPDVKIVDFYEKEVIEFIMTIYQIYYGNAFSNVDYEITDEDWELLKKKYKYDKDPKDFLNAQAQYNAKKWRPKYDIFLDALEYNVLPPDFKKSAIVKNQQGVYEFSYPKYGDFTLAREAVRVAFAGEEQRFDTLKKKIDIRDQIEDRIRAGEPIDMKQLPPITASEINEYNN